MRAGGRLFENMNGPVWRMMKKFTKGLSQLALPRSAKSRRGWFLRNGGSPGPTEVLIILSEKEGVQRLRGASEKQLRSPTRSPFIGRDQDSADDLGPTTSAFVAVESATGRESVGSKNSDKDKYCFQSLTSDYEHGNDMMEGLIETMRFWNLSQMRQHQ